MHIFSSSDTFSKLFPIVSSIGTYNYDLARSKIVSEIKNANLSGKFLVFYNVTSLFTNIPLQETIGVAVNAIFKHNSNLNITKKELKNFSFCYITDSFSF